MHVHWEEINKDTKDIYQNMKEAGTVTTQAFARFCEPWTNYTFYTNKNDLLCKNMMAFDCLRVVGQELHTKTEM